MNQKDAVFQAVSSVVGDFSGAVELTSSQRSEVNDQLVGMFLRGEVDYRGGVPSEEAIRKYVPGLVNNWLRKDTRLTGGAKYQPKNPGSRSGSSDEGVKAMKQLLSITSDPDARLRIEAAIRERQEELKPKKVINIDALPEELRHLVSQN